MTGLLMILDLIRRQVCQVPVGMFSLELVQGCLAGRESSDWPFVWDPRFNPFLLNSSLWDFTNFSISCRNSGFSIHWSMIASLITKESFIAKQTEYSGWGGGSTFFRSCTACLKFGNPSIARCPFRARSKDLFATIEAQKLDSVGECATVATAIFFPDQYVHRKKCNDTTS